MKRWRSAVYVFKTILIIIFSLIVIVFITITIVLQQNRIRYEKLAQICANNLKQLYIGLKSYADEHNTFLPPSLQDLLPKYLSDPQILVCPTVPYFDGEPQGNPDDWSSYTYQPGWRIDMDPRAVIVVEKNSNHNGQYLELHLNGEVGISPGPIKLSKGDLESDSKNNTTLKSGKTAEPVSQGQTKPNVAISESQSSKSEEGSVSLPTNIKNTNGRLSIAIDQAISDGSLCWDGIQGVAEYKVNFNLTKDFRGFNPFLVKMKQDKIILVSSKNIQDEVEYEYELFLAGWPSRTTRKQTVADFVGQMCQPNLRKIYVDLTLRRPINDRFWEHITNLSDFRGYLLDSYIVLYPLSVPLEGGKKPFLHFSDGMAFADIIIGVNAKPASGQGIKRINTSENIYDFLEYNAIIEICDPFSWSDGIFNPGSRFYTVKGQWHLVQ